MSCDFVITDGNKTINSTVVHLSISFDQLAMSSNCKTSILEFDAIFPFDEAKKIVKFILHAFRRETLVRFINFNQRESTTCLGRREDLLCRYSHIILVTFQNWCWKRLRKSLFRQLCALIGLKGKWTIWPIVKFSWDSKLSRERLD